MKVLWAPWRMRYIRSPKRHGCIFCEKPGEGRDRENLILYRGRKCFVIMNRYPYNNGHLMVAPYRHVGDFEGLEEEEMAEIMRLLAMSVKALRRAYRPDGFNIGVNLGRAAGAGVEGHIHFHVVPRWVGDTNFMPVFSETRVIPELLEETYNKLLKHFR